MKILYIQHEMLVWNSAKQWSYTTHLAYVDGLRAQGHDVQVLLTSLWPWARQMVGHQTYDQVWINDVLHSIGNRPAWESAHRFNEADFAWFATLAPVRVGIVMETLQYDPADYEEVPELLGRVPLLKATVLPHITHLCVVDDIDVKFIEAMDVPAVWTPAHVPQRFFRNPQPRPDLPASFIGSAYARRQKYLHCAALNGLLEFRKSGEHSTTLPVMYEQLNLELRIPMLAQPFRQDDADNFQATVHQVRESLFSCFLDGLTGAMASVNLPSYVKTYGGRVIESMVIGQPVVSWRIPNRPGTAQLFGEGETILLFDNDSPELLAEQLQRLRNDAGLCYGLAIRAQANARKHHTTEHRVGQVLEFIRSGRTPVFWD